MAYRKWDTPTDGISRKKFDRAMDAHIRRYVTAMEGVRTLEIRCQRLESALKFLISSELGEEE